MDANNFVWGYLYPFLWDVIHAVGGADSDVDNLYGWLTGFQNTFWSPIFVALLLPPIALWQLVKNIASDIHNALDWINWFVRAVIAPTWQWLINTLQWAAAELGQLGATITAVATAVVSAFVDALWVVIHALQYQVANILSTVATDIANAIVWVTTQLTNLKNLLNQIEQQIQTWVQGFVNGVIANLVAQIKPLLDFLAWWQNTGSKVLVEFVNNPSQFILNLIVDDFLEWVLCVIARNW